MAGKIPVSVLVVTRNAGTQLQACLDALQAFDEIIVIDSGSTDDTAAIARQANAPLVNFTWNGQYPKKRQWCLANVATRHEWIFFVDADEIVPPRLCAEIADHLHTPHAAFFVRGQPVFAGRLLRYGRWNNKIVLARRGKIRFPVIDDLDLPGMGEIEGHYQPRIIGPVGQLHTPLTHACAETPAAWFDRHRRYADWQAAIESRGIHLAASETGLRRVAKTLFNATGLRPALAFIDSYIVKKGLCDGGAGWRYAVARAWYYRLIAARKRAIANTAADISHAASR